VVAETFDGRLNDMDGFHVRPEHALAALDAAKSGAVEEGNVGGGTGMVCFGFKGGIGTASRQVLIGEAHYTVGVLVQCNTGDRTILRIAGAPVGQELAGRWLPCYVANLAPPGKQPLCAGDAKAGKAPGDSGSIIIVVATDAPLIPTQLNRVAKRAALGLGRLGSYSGNSSGDLIVSFTTSGVANHPEQKAPSPIAQIASDSIDPLFEGTVEATEEAIVNAMIAADTMTGIDGHRYYRLPHAELREILKRYGRLGVKH
jgi:L-aminopeptidase/D-esterase-like protein